MKNLIAYKGDEFIIEWYYNAKGESQALEYYQELSQGQKAKLSFLFQMLGDTGKIRSEEKFRHEGDQIYAFKPMPDRFLCFFYHGGKVIVTNAFEKKQDKMPAKEKDKALKFKADYIKRNREESYYD
jgi:phage-related protein